MAIKYGATRRTNRIPQAQDTVQAIAVQGRLTAEAQLMKAQAAKTNKASLSAYDEAVASTMQGGAGGQDREHGNPLLRPG